MKLYELTTEYQTVADLAATATGEDSQAFLDTLEGIAGEIGNKVLACARVYRMLETQAVAVSAEVDRLAKRKQSLESNAKHLKAYMQRGMEAAGQQKIEDDLFTVAIQNNPAAVVLNNDDIKTLPQRFLRTEVTTVALKKELSAALKANDAEAMQYARLESTKSLRIR